MNAANAMRKANVIGGCSSEECEAWANCDLEEVLVCPVCESEARHPLHWGLRDRVFQCVPGTWDLYRCEGCRSAYLNPRPTLDSIGRAYVRYYTHGGNWRVPPELLSRLRHLLRGFANGYFNSRFGTHFEPEFRLGAALVRLLPGKRRKLDQIGRHLPKNGDGRTLLDVGCGNGHFLELAVAAGWNAVGLDVDALAVRNCVDRGLRVEFGGLENFPDPDRLFDWITLSHVIEHVHDPVALLSGCFERLRPGGHLWIATPNLNSIGHGMFGANWLSLDPPRHLVLFHRRSLIDALVRCGFEEVHDNPFSPEFGELARMSRAIANGDDPFRRTGWDWPTLGEIGADLRGWRSVDIRESVTLGARKPWC